MRKYRIVWVSWNEANRRTLGFVWATCPELARVAGYRKWPCGNGQTYEALPVEG